MLYHPSVISGWKSGGCFDTFQRRLGYRLVLKSLDAPSTIGQGATLAATLTLTNVGYAAPAHDYALSLVLRKGAALTPLAFATSGSKSTRFWLAGATQTLAGSWCDAARLLFASFL